MISYSGETPILIRAVEVLKLHGIPVVVITNIGESRLSKMADCVLRIDSGRTIEVGRRLTTVDIIREE